MGPILKASIAYGFVGLTFDALQGTTKTLYVGPAGAAVGWRVRF